MGDFTLSLCVTVAKAIVKVFATAFTKYVMSRIKERTAPISGRDGSDNN